MEKIFTGKDKAKELGYLSYRDYVTALGLKYRHPWNGKSTTKLSVTARVDFGRWIADCQCGAAQYVEPEQPFYCAECGMPYSEGMGIKVIFPKIKEDIEEELLQRETIATKNTPATIQPPPKEAGLARSWNPGETVTELKEQRKRRSKK